MIEKAADSAADYVFLDLEDAVAPLDKIAARKNIIEALNDIDWKAKVDAPIKSIKPSSFISVNASINSATGTSELSLCRQKISNFLICRRSKDSSICGLINWGSH